MLRVRVALVVAFVLFVQAFGPPALADEPAAEAREEARERFDRGVELYNEQEYERALIEFERAYSLAPSYVVLYNVAQVSAQLRRYAKAVAAYERYLAEGGARIPEERVAQVQQELAAARARTAKLLVRVDPPGAEISLDDQPLTTSPMAAAVLVDSGERRITVSKMGFRTTTRLVVLAGGDDADLNVRLEPLPAPPTPIAERPLPAEAPSRAPMWISWGTAGALGVGTAVFAVFALSASSELDRLKETRGTSESERDDVASRIQTFAAVTDVLGIATLAAAGVAVYFTLRKHGPPASSRPAAERMMLRGTF